MENTNNTIPVKKSNKLKRYLILTMLFGLIIYAGYYAYTRFWPLSDKQTAGKLQSFGKDGRFISTFEGSMLTNELITNTDGGISERRLVFSAQDNKELIDFLNANVGKEILVSYKKYEKPFLFRGNSQYIIYKASLAQK